MPELNRAGLLLTGPGGGYRFKAGWTTFWLEERMGSTTTTEAALCLALLGGAAGCGSKTEPEQPKPAAVVFEDRLVVSDTDDRSPLGIPPAQLPTAGHCRVWYPERRPAQQPPAEPCAKAEAAATGESWILYRPREDPRLVHVRILDPDQAGAVLRVRVYDAERGTYLGTRQAVRAKPSR
jgi:hypothetical protein